MNGRQPRRAVIIGVTLLPVFFYALFRFSIGLVLPEVVNEFELDSLRAGLVLSASLGATTATTGLAGFLSDKFGERLVLFAGLLLYAVSLGAAMLAPTFEVFTIFMVANGLGSGLMLTPTYSVIGAIMPRSRGIGIGAISGVYNIGGFVGPAMTSFLLTAYGWKLPFSIFAITSLGAAFLLLFLLRIPRRIKPSRDSAGGREGLSFLFRRNTLVVAASMFLADLAFLAFISWAPTFMRANLNIPAETTGLSFGFAILIGALGVMSMGYVFDKAGGKKTTILCGAASAALTFAFFIQPSGSIATLAILLLTGFITNTFWSLLSALSQVGVEEHQLGTVTGFVQNIAFIGAAIGPSLVGAIVSATVLSEAMILAVSVPYLIYTMLMFLYKE